ncbi:MAG TPA: tRNA pseudouridine(13) synthase TruD [Rudaea sp.]|nr:tRNA pseudouridine(13) synthase TruD [Rudaea sp.]
MSVNATAELPFAYGGPPLRGTLRSSPEDFLVDEDLGFAPDGAGEHVFVRIEKRGANTDWVARELARFAGVGADAVSYAGLKDRHAVARQTFSIHLPGRPDLDWSALAHPEFRVLGAARHARKLKRGALDANLFTIVLRGVAGDRDAAARRLADIAARGVPNYFGEQRFGRGGANLDKARAMFAGRRLPRHERSLLLSSARSHLFNLALAARIERGGWLRPLDGEVWMLAGSRSIFGPEPLSAELRARHEANDIAPTGPLWGAGELRSAGEVAALEQAVAAAHPDLSAGVVAAGLSQERRSLVLIPQGFASTWIAADALELSFRLPAGAYATAVLREVCDWA